VVFHFGAAFSIVMNKVWCTSVWFDCVGTKCHNDWARMEELYLMNPRPSSQKASYHETPCNIPQFKVYPHAHFWWSQVSNLTAEFSPFKFVYSSVFKSITSEETLNMGFTVLPPWISRKSLQWRPVVVDVNGIAGRGMRAYFNMSIFRGSGGCNMA
jgi:hypothetical protein